MNSQQSDYLWDPNGTYDEDVGAIENRLRPLSAESLQLADRPLPIATRRSVAVVWRFAAAFVGIVLLGVGAFQYRLSWKEGTPWRAVIENQDGATRAALLRVDERIATLSGESLTLNAARIGNVTISPDSVVRLIETRKGRHRLELEQGRLHAKIWAPQNYFAVRSGTSVFVDLGCEFELEMNAAGDGALFVRSGFVIHRVDDSELLVPAGYRVTLIDHRTSTPIRPDASEKFRAAVKVLDRMLKSNDLASAAMMSAKSRGVSDEIAESAVDADYYTLLDLLVRHPELAATELYPRLALALRAPNDDQHRAKWIEGDADAREEWWDKLPRQPKTWWLNWRDAF